MVLVDMAPPLADALRRPRKFRRIADWLAWHDIFDLAREARRA